MSKVTDAAYEEYRAKHEWVSHKATWNAGVSAALKILGGCENGDFSIVVTNDFGGTMREVLHERFDTLYHATVVFTRLVMQYGTDKHRVELRTKDGTLVGRFSTAAHKRT